jgi:MFS transporter, MHS family, proline/betaine transporter
LGGITSFVLRATLTHDQLVVWGWRIPFLFGIVVSYFGFYLRSHGSDHDGYHVPGRRRNAQGSAAYTNGTSSDEADDSNNSGDSYVVSTHDDEILSMDATAKNPLVEAFSRKNIRPLCAAALVPMLWASGFYLSFVWMAIFMADLIDTPVPGAFLINSMALLFSVCLVFPLSGYLSDRFGRVRVMTIGGTMMAIFGPALVVTIGRGNPVLAFASQCILGISLSLFAAPMCAWLVEAFEPSARLTSVAIGYNMAQAIAGGGTPFLATLMTEQLGEKWPGWILTVVAMTSLFGLHCVSPKPPSQYLNKDSAVHISAAGRENEII